MAPASPHDRARRRPRQRSQAANTAATQQVDQPKVTRDEKGHKVYPINPASPLRRTYAFLLDLFFLYMIVVITKQAFGDAVWHPEVAARDIAIILAYFVLPTAIWGKTIGKWVAGIVVVDREGYIPGLPLAIPREVGGRAVAIALAGIGILWMFFDKKNQGLHDKIAGTFVVEDPAGSVILRSFFPKRE